MNEYKRISKESPKFDPSVDGLDLVRTVKLETKQVTKQEDTVHLLEALRIHADIQILKLSIDNKKKS